MAGFSKPKIPQPSVFDRREKATVPNKGASAALRNSISNAPSLQVVTARVYMARSHTYKLILWVFL